MTTLLEAWAIAAARECEAASLWERGTPDDEWRAADAHVRAYEQLQEATNHLRAAALRANRLDPERPAPYPVAVFIDRCLVVVSPSPDELPNHGCPVQRDCTIVIRQEDLPRGE
jgi:hypothetical protein